MSMTTLAGNVSSSTPAAVCLASCSRGSRTAASTRLHVDCGMLDRLGDTWTVLVVGLPEADPVRFNRLRAALPGISQKMLTSPCARSSATGWCPAR